jgi:hypothetical protein
VRTHFLEGHKNLGDVDDDACSGNFDTRMEFAELEIHVSIFVSGSFFVGVTGSLATSERQWINWKPQKPTCSLTDISLDDAASATWGRLERDFLRQSHLAKARTGGITWSRLVEWCWRMAVLGLRGVGDGE